jgi:Protein of unknown function (DUF1566)
MNRPWSRFTSAAIIAMVLVIAIGARASAPAGRYDIANGMVYDIKTNLTWQQVISPGMYTQAEAVRHCATLGLNGVTWRLPTMREILTIVDISVAPPGPTIDAKAFPNTPIGFYWSSTHYSGTPSNFWSAQFQFGFAYGNTLTDTSYARCVSSGRAAGLAAGLGK